jgi:hypothetical protein
VSETAVVAIAGRRIDAQDADPPQFPLRSVPLVRKRLAELLVAENARALVSSAACGSDLIGLEEAERIKIRRRIVLPFSPDKFRATSVVDRPGDWGPGFDRLVAHAAAQGDLVVDERGENDGDAAYAEVTQLILDEAKALARTIAGGPHRLVAVVVWEGRPRPGNDLTDDFKTAAIAAGFALRVILTE